MSFHPREDSSNRSSLRSAHTFPQLRGSPVESSPKKRKYKSSERLSRSHGEFRSYKGVRKKSKDEWPGQQRRVIVADGKPSNHGRREGTSQESSASRSNSRGRQNSLSNQGRDSGGEESMEDEPERNEHIPSSTLEKVFPESNRQPHLPVYDPTVDSGEGSDFECLTPPDGGAPPDVPVDVQSLHISEKSYTPRSLPQFIDHAPRSVKAVFPTREGRHQNRRRTRAAPSSEPSLTSVPRLDMRDGRSRLKTFDEFWPDDSAFFNTRILVRYGFYAIGQGDAVRCFSCDKTIANWERDDDAKQRHFDISPDCRFMNGHSCGNKPLSPVRKSKLHPAGTTARDRRVRARNRPHRPQVVKSRSPIHYQDRAPSPVAETRYRSSSPRRPRRRGDSRRRSISSPPRSPTEREDLGISEVYANPTAELMERTNLMDIFRCLDPVNPNLSEESVRRRSFQVSAFRSHTRLFASDAVLAEAGLYYAGNSDDTVCWYCGGGLRQFNERDDPWVEHAKYFPNCEYLMQQRGPDFIAEVSRRYPNVIRPGIPSMQNLSVPQPRLPASPQAPTQAPPQTTPTLPPIPQPRPTPPAVPRVSSTPTLPPVPPQTRVIPEPFTQPPRPNNPPPPPPRDPPQPGELRTTSGVRIEDPQAAIQSRERMVEESLQSEQVATARQMGFTEDQIRTAQMRRVVGLGGPYPTADLLIESILNPDTDPALLEQPEEAPAEPQFEPHGQPRRNVTMTNSTIRITGGNFGQTVIGSRRGRSRIIIDGLPLHEYLARQREEAGEGTAAPFVFNNVGTSVGTSVRTTPVGTAAGTMPVGTAVGTTLGSTRPYNTAPAPSAPMMAETSTTPSGIGPSTSTGAAGASGGSTQQRLEALEKEYQCKICLSSRVEVLFEPCGHICACLDCGRRVTHCPVCRIRITRYIRTYHA